MSNPNTKWKTEPTLRSANQLQELLVKDKARLEPRLPAGTLPGFAADTHELSEKGASAVSSRATKKAATKTQDECADEVMARTIAMRAAAKQGRVSAAVAKAMGIGLRIVPGSVKSVLAAADTVIGAYAKYVDEMRGVGILPEDIETLLALAGKLRSVDATQEASKVTSKESTAARKAVQVRVERAIGLILAAAELTLVDDPGRLALYRAALPPSPRKKKTPAPTK